MTKQSINRSYNLLLLYMICDTKIIKIFFTNINYFKYHQYDSFKLLTFMVIYIRNQNTSS